MKKITFLIVALLMSSFVISQTCDQTITVSHSPATSTDIETMLSNDGVSSALINGFSGNYVYKIIINGGGGYYTHTDMMMCLDGVTPISCIAKGVSDATDAFRTSIGTDGTFTTMYDFNNLGWVDASSYTTANELFMQLDSKWGTNIDTYIYLYIGTNQKISNLGYGLLDSYPDDFGSITVDGYSISAAPIPLSNWSILLGILLIIGYGVMQYKRRFA